MSEIQSVLDKKISAFVNATGPILAIDIGSETQDALLALPQEHPENWPRFVLPAPSRLIAKQLTKYTQQKQHVWLYGNNMGGGFGKAVHTHCAAGLKLASTLAASAALHDNPERVIAMGVQLTDDCPDEHVPLRLSDFSIERWQTLLTAMSLPQPVRILAAAQDHGHHPKPNTNRSGRMAQWRQLLEQTNNPAEWLYTSPPPLLSRLAALYEATGGMVADTGTAAVLGALFVPEVVEKSHKQGVCIVNMGNSHVLAFLVYRERVYGIYEQHTGLRQQSEILHDLHEFCLGWLPDEQIRQQGGHGVVFHKNMPAEAEGFQPRYILGPRREFLRGQGQFIAPKGDMMLAGAYGLLYGAALQSMQK